MKNNMYNSLMLLSPDQEAGGSEVAVQEAPAAVKEVIKFPDPDTGTLVEYKENDDGEAYVERDGFQITVGEFTGANKGLLFHMPIPTTIKSATDKWGEAAILKLIQDAVRDGARSHAKATKIPSYENEASQKKAIEDLKKTNHGVLITINEALKMNPCEKRETSVSIAAQIKDAKKNPNTTKTELRALVQKFNEALMREAARSGLAD